MSRVPLRFALVALLAVACRERAERAPEATLVDLDSSLAAARVDFNAHRGENRFLALLAPT